MTKILFTLSILFSITSFAGNGGSEVCSGGGCGGHKVTWADFKRDCETAGGYATPVPSQCANYAALAAANSSINYQSIPDGSSPNQKCCVKCNGPMMMIGTGSAADQQKCNNSNGAIWIAATPPKPSGCCYKPAPSHSNPTGSSSQAVAIRNKMCFPGTTYVTPADYSPVPTNAAACTAANPAWTWNSFGLGSCCKPQ